MRAYSATWVTDQLAVGAAPMSYEQLDCLRSEGCSEAQGYLFGRPSPSEGDAPEIDRINREQRKARDAA